QHHHGALVEDHLQLEPEVADHGEHDALVRVPRRDDRLADGERRNTAALQLGDESRRWTRSEHTRLPGRRPVQDRSALDDDPSEELKLAERATEVIQLTSGDEQESAARVRELPQ